MMDELPICGRSLDNGLTVLDEVSAAEAPDKLGAFC